MTIYICDKFSLSMLNRDTQEEPKPGSWHNTIDSSTRVPIPISRERAHFLARNNCVSAIEDRNIAAVYADDLGLWLNPRRIDIKLQKGDHAIVGQYVGPELAKNAVELPEGATIEWWLI